MAGRTLLQIVQAAANEITITAPSSVVSSIDDTAQALLAFANRSGYTLSLAGLWESLIKRNEFVTVAGQQGYDFPSDYRKIIPSTQWNSDQRFRLYGPVTAQEWETIVNYNNQTEVTYYFRIFDGKFRLHPTPSQVQNLVYEYISSDWVLDADGTTTKSLFSADTDTTILDDDLIVMDIVWRYKKAKGFDYMEDKREFESMRNMRLGDSHSARVINMASGNVRFPVNIPEGSFAL